MNRLRSTTCAVLASLGLLSGCSSFGSSSSGTSWFSRLTHRRNNTCDCCETVGFGGVPGSCCSTGCGCGIGGCCEGPDLGVPEAYPMGLPGAGASLPGAGPMLPPTAVPSTIGPMPNVAPQQALPLPAGPSSRRTGSTVSR